MSWAKVDDRANENPKLLAAGARAAWLWVCGLMYCNRQHRKDGRIPKAALSLLFPGMGRREVGRLLAAGLWHDDGDSYAVHDYAQWNGEGPSLSSKRAAAGRKGGSATRRPNVATPQTSTPPGGSKPGAVAPSNLEATVKPLLQAAGSTPPHPTPRGNSPKPPKGGKPKQPRKKPEQDTDPRIRQLWDHYHEEHQRVRGQPPAFTDRQHGQVAKAWKDMLSTVDLDEAKRVVSRALAEGYHVQPWRIVSELNRYRGTGGRAGQQPLSHTQTPHGKRGTEDARRN